MTSKTELANAIRVLSMDAVQTAKSGHPGAPMGMADIAEVLWNDFLSHNPTDPNWCNRDRFILSNGHGSMLIYSLLHLTGYDLSIDDIKQFRQLHAKTAGHPEYGYAPGIETTTGPLGQGIANGVGMAIAEKTLAAQFNRPDYPIVDHYTWVFLGDGCLMEGISHEACSLAGTLGLGKLIAFYDDNNISIDGEVGGWFTDNTPQRFAAYNWQVIPDVDGHDAKAIAAAITAAQANPDQPTLICCKTLIGKGSPNKAGTESCHGAPLGEDEIAQTRANLGWQHAPFEIPAAVYEGFDAKAKGQQAQQLWQALFENYSAAFPELASEFNRRVVNRELPANFSEIASQFIQSCQANREDIASRKASQNAIKAFAPHLPELIGGSADLAGSNLTLWPEAKGITATDASGNYIFYGVREFAMSALMNGMALHGGFIPFGGTFLIFMEYARNAVRMAALMKQRSLFVYTHDSIGLGEDGPTHQPIEQLANLRYTPNLDTWRPCDTVESAVAWQAALEKADGPSALVFSRQGLPCQPRDSAQVDNIKKGGYVLMQNSATPELILIATGSEIGLAVDAYQALIAQDKKVRVVSMPSTTVFDRQSAEYKEQVLPMTVLPRIAIEAASADFWFKYVGLDGRVIGMNSFGESAPAKDLYPFFGFTTERIVSEALELLDHDMD